LQAPVKLAAEAQVAQVHKLPRALPIVVPQQSAFSAWIPVVARIHTRSAQLALALDFNQRTGYNQFSKTTNNNRTCFQQ